MDTLSLLEVILFQIPMTDPSDLDKFLVAPGPRQRYCVDVRSSVLEHREQLGVLYLGNETVRNELRYVHLYALCREMSASVEAE